MFKRTDTILFLISSISINALTILQWNGTFILFGLAQLLLGLLLAVAIILSIIKTVKDKKQISLIQKLRPLLFGLFLTATIPLTIYLTITDGGKKTILHAGVNGDLTFVSLHLRDDGTFKLTNSGPFGSENYRGHFTFRHDTLHLDNGDTNLYPTLTFVKKYHPKRKKEYFDPIPKDTTTKVIYELYIQTDNSSHR